MGHAATPFTIALLALAGSTWVVAPARADADPAASPPARAADVPAVAGAPVAAPARRSATLDDLFARLAAAKSEDEANGVARLIERRLERSGSDTADLLMTRAGEALQAKDAALAVEILDRVLALRPDWAEAWSRRAAAFYLLDDPARAVSDLGQALAREPRHYDAMESLGRLELAAGDEKHALQVFRRALETHPFLKGVREVVDKLAPKIDGRDL